MTDAMVGALIAIAILLLALLAYERQCAAKILKDAYTDFREERSELLSRIQHPERLPVPVMLPVEHPVDLEELELIGQIVHDD